VLGWDGGIALRFIEPPNADTRNHEGPDDPRVIDVLRDLIKQFFDKIMV
jgi:hypothetical protein